MSPILPGQRGGPHERNLGHVVEEYPGFVEKEYPGTYVASGGAAVKLVIPEGAAAAQCSGSGLADIAGRGGFAHAAVDATHTRGHLVDRLFFEVARQIDWMALAAHVLYTAYQTAGFPASGTEPAELTVAAVAAEHGIDTMELYRSLRRTLEAAVLADASLAHEFRVAMLRFVPGADRPRRHRRVRSADGARLADRGESAGDPTARGTAAQPDHPLRRA